MQLNHVSSMLCNKTHHHHNWNCLNGKEQLSLVSSKIMEAFSHKIATLDGVALRGASEKFAQIENFWVNDVKALLFCYEYHT